MVNPECSLRRAGQFYGYPSHVNYLAGGEVNVPAVYLSPASARDGGLLSYGADFHDIFRRAARYVVAFYAAQSRLDSRSKCP